MYANYHPSAQYHKQYEKVPKKLSVGYNSKQKEDTPPRMEYYITIKGKWGIGYP